MWAGSSMGLEAKGSSHARITGSQAWDELHDLPEASSVRGDPARGLGEPEGTRCASRSAAFRSACGGSRETRVWPPRPEHCPPHPPVSLAPPRAPGGQGRAPEQMVFRLQGPRARGQAGVTGRLGTLDPAARSVWRQAAQWGQTRGPTRSGGRYAPPPAGTERESGSRGPCAQTQHSCHPAGGPQRPSWPGAAAERLASPGSRHVTGSRAAGHPLAGVARGPGRGRAGGDPASRQAPAPHCPSSRPHGGPSTTAERAGARSGATATEETSPARSDTLFSLLRLSPRESDGSAMPGDTPKAKELQTRRVPVRSLRSHCR